MRQVLAAAVLAVLAGCTSAASGSAAAPPRAAAPASPALTPRAPGAAFCARLKANPKTVRVVYADEVERQVGLASGHGSVTPDSIQAARTIVALWITISCPRFAWLEKGG